MTLHDLTGALRITGVPQATGERNEDGTYHIKLTATVAGETGFKGSLKRETKRENSKPKYETLIIGCDLAQGHDFTGGIE